VALAEAIRPFCAATGSALNVGTCEGLTLGAHPPLEGTHDGTGITFRGLAEVIRHLGVLLTKGDRDAAAREMWQRRIDAVAARARHWSGIDLSLLGRVHVAKSTMASTVVHIASFIPAPEPQARALQAIIDGYIYGKPPVAATDDRPLIHHPSKAAACLPREEGGLGAPDVRLQATALLAKTAARLVHPQRRVWKDIDRRRFDKGLPGLGIGAMTTRLRPRQAAPGFPRRLSACWAALQATRPHRLVPPGAMLAHQVAREPLFFWQTCGYTGEGRCRAPACNLEGEGEGARPRTREGRRGADTRESPGGASRERWGARERTYAEPREEGGRRHAKSRPVGAARRNSTRGRRLPAVSVT
jgi:hypothetical protein